MQRTRVTLCVYFLWKAVVDVEDYTSLPNHVTVASRTTEIMAVWISRNIDIRRSLNSRDSFPKIGLRQAVDQVTYYDYQPSGLSCRRKWRKWRRRQR